jgi:hypothetical protein
MNWTVLLMMIFFNTYLHGVGEVTLFYFLQLKITQAEKKIKAAGGAVLLTA